MDVSVIVLEVAVAVLAQAAVQGLGWHTLCHVGVWLSDPKQKLQEDILWMKGNVPNLFWRRLAP